jgi:DNA-binding CsgD family transcriptional regulator
LYRNYFRKKNEKQLTLIKSAEEEKRSYQEERFERDKLKTEKEILLLRDENLGLEIKKKNSELASSTLNNIKKNELLVKLIEDIEKIDKELLNNSLHMPIRKIINNINYHLVDKDDWLTFELNFRNAHTDFFKKLRDKHPDLSSNEIKLSAYLKLNLSSKEIASLMHISIKSIEQARYRLRKKLNLPQDSSLVNYIQTFSTATGPILEPVERQDLT